MRSMEMNSASLAGDSGDWGLSGSLINALSPLPNAFRVMANHLPSQFDIALGAAAGGVVKKYRLAVAWRLRQPHVSRNHCAKDPVAEEALQVSAYLVLKIR